MRWLTSEVPALVLRHRAETATVTLDVRDLVRTVCSKDGKVESGRKLDKDSKINS